MGDYGLMAKIREWINEGVGRWVAIGVAVLVIAVAAYAVYSHATSSPTDDLRTARQRTMVQCKACKEISEVEVGYTEVFPVKCPKCGAQEAVAVVKCVQCGQYFDRDILKAKRSKCPHCGRVYVSGE